jgi:transcriptional regulator with XRE-family HTH domain
MNQALGDKIRGAREARGLSVEELSSITKISQEFIIALEDGRWDLLPGQVYLKPFTKLCGEALELDIKELYYLIDGTKPAMESRPSITANAEKQAPRSFDYKLPIVLIGALIILALIIITVNTNQKERSQKGQNEVIPARGIKKEYKTNWQKEWERPPDNSVMANRNRLRLEASDAVWACVVAEGDTLYKDYIKPGVGKTFTSRSDFLVSLGKNDCVQAYYNGMKVKAIGTNYRPLMNLRVGENSEQEK